MGTLEREGSMRETSAALAGVAPCAEGLPSVLPYYHIHTYIHTQSDSKTIYAFSTSMQTEVSGKQMHT